MANSIILETNGASEVLGEMHRSWQLLRRCSYFSWASEPLAESGCRGYRLRGEYLGRAICSGFVPQRISGSPSFNL